MPNIRLRTRCLGVSVVLCLVAVFPSHPVLGEGDDEEVTLAKKAYRLAATEAKSYQLMLGDAPLKLEPVPVMRWSNPISGQVFGDVYVWTLDGRPEAIASIFKWFSPNTHLSAEFQSLSQSPLTMTQGSRRVWNPGTGLTMKRLDTNTQPRPQPFARLQQMKSLASEFTAEAVDRNDANKTWRLPLRSKPVFRYRSDSQGIADGAVFAFCQENTTNPEVMLLIEAVQSDESSHWLYGLGRQNSIQFRVFQRGQLVWDVPKLAPPWQNIRRPDRAYINLQSHPE